MSGSELVVGVDGSAGALAAVRWAARVARERRLGLRLVHALPELPAPYPRIDPTYEELLEAAGKQGRVLLAEARDAASGIDAETVLRPERAVDALVAESGDAAMLVLGTPGLRPVGRILFGSVTVALTAHAHCPVALIRPHAGEDEPPAEGPVVVGVDGSPASEEAIAVAFEEASWRDVPLVAVHCRHRDGWWDTGKVAEEYAHELLGQRLAGWGGKYPDVVVRREVMAGRATECLLDFADHAQLLVVGSRGRGGFGGLALGSTSQSLMSYALCPVVVARLRAT
ncbi:universal stress protein [Amycolatopsis sp. NPDC049688]|uniref:universal stress protein n=1 Tax=Amycolatopsis sp. NPDC049688 TaxID=3154733 RepID=UPI00344040CA